MRFVPDQAMAAPSPAGWSLVALNPSRLIAGEAGQIADAAAGRAGAPLLIHIQDPHANISGQESIAALLADLFVRYGTVPVLVEGGTGDDSLGAVKAQAPASAWKKAARKFLLEGKLAGEEYLALTSDYDVRILGVEEASQYRRGLRAYADLAAVRDETKARIKRLRAAVEVLKRTGYGQDLRRLDEACGEDGRAADCARQLAPTTDAGSFPNLSRFQAALEQESAVDFEAARLEQAALFEKIGPDLTESERKALTARPADGRDLAVRSGAFGVLQDAAARAGIGLDAFPALTAYRGYLASMSEIRFDALLQDMRRAAEARFEAAPAEARRLHAIDRRLMLLERAQDIRLSSDEFEELSRPGEWTETAIEAYLNRRLAERGSFRDLIPASDRLTKAAPLVRAFYESAAERDETFVRNAEKWMNRERADVAVLIAGGYHTESLKKRFREKGWSYAVLAPRVVSETVQEKYERVLLEPLRRKNVQPGLPADAAGSGISAARIAETEFAAGRLQELLQTAKGFSNAGSAAAVLQPAAANIGARLAVLDTHPLKHVVDQLRANLRDPARDFMTIESVRHMKIWPKVLAYDRARQILRNLVAAGIFEETPGREIQYRFVDWIERNRAVDAVWTEIERVFDYEGIRTIHELADSIDEARESLSARGFLGARLAASVAAPSSAAASSLDGMALISYVHTYGTPGGASTHLEYLNRALLMRHAMTIYQIYPVTGFETKSHSPWEEEFIGRGKLIHVPAGRTNEFGSAPDEIVQPPRFRDAMLRLAAQAARRLLPEFAKGLIKSLLFDERLASVLFRIPGVSGLLGGPAALQYEFRTVLSRIAAETRGAPTVFVDHDPINVLAMARARDVRQFGIPAAFEFHGGNEAYLKQLRLLAKLERPSGVTAKGFEGLEGFRNLGNGIDTSRFDPAASPRGAFRAKFGIGRDRFVVLVPARVEPAKGQKLLLEAFSRFSRYAAADGPIDWVLAGVPQDAKYADDLKRLAARVPALAGKVHFVGHLAEEDMLAAYADADVVALPTLSEGVPRALLEAQSMGAPVVATDVGGVSEAFVDGRSGFLVPDKDFRGMVFRLDELASNPQLRQSLASAARPFIEEKFSLESLAARHAEFYLDILRQDARAARPSGARLADAAERYSEREAVRVVDALFRAGGGIPDDIRTEYFDNGEVARARGAQILNPASFSEAGRSAASGRLWNSPDLAALYREGWAKVGALAEEHAKHVPLYGRERFTEQNRQLLMRAYVLAFVAHQFFPQKPSKRVRRAGRGEAAYIIHPVDVAMSLEKEFSHFPDGASYARRADVESLVVALLHDIFEDTRLRRLRTPTFIRLLGLQRSPSSAAFGRRILRLTRFLSKRVSRSGDAESDKRFFLRMIHSEMRGLENPQATLYKMMLIKLADKLNSARHDLDLVSTETLTRDQAESILKFHRQRRDFAKYFANFVYRSGDEHMSRAALYWAREFLTISAFQRRRIRERGFGDLLVPTPEERQSTDVRKIGEDLWEAEGIASPRNGTFRIVEAATLGDRDFRQYARLVQKAFPPFWRENWLRSPSMIRENLRRKREFAGMAVVALGADGQPVGVVGAYFFDRSTDGGSHAPTLISLAADGAARGRGVTHVMAEDIRERFYSGNPRGEIEIYTLPVSLSDHVNPSTGYVRISVSRLEDVLNVGPTRRVEGARLANGTPSEKMPQARKFDELSQRYRRDYGDNAYGDAVEWIRAVHAIPMEKKKDRLFHENAQPFMNYVIATAERRPAGMEPQADFDRLNLLLQDVTAELETLRAVLRSRTLSGKEHRDFLDSHAAFLGKVQYLFIPLLARFGQDAAADEMGDMLFEILNPEKYAEIQKDLAVMFYVDDVGSVRERLQQLETEFRRRLDAAGVPATVEATVKTPFSIYEKLLTEKTKYRSIEELPDLFRIRIVFGPQEGLTWSQTRDEVVIPAMHRVLRVSRIVFDQKDPEDWHLSVVDESPGRTFEFQLKSMAIDRRQKSAGEASEPGKKSHWIYKTERFYETFGLNKPPLEADAIDLTGDFGADFAAIYAVQKQRTHVLAFLEKTEWYGMKKSSRLVIDSFPAGSVTADLAARRQIDALSPQTRVREIVRPEFGRSGFEGHGRQVGLTAPLKNGQILSVLVDTSTPTAAPWDRARRRDLENAAQTIRAKLALHTGEEREELREKGERAVLQWTEGVRDTRGKTPNLLRIKRSVEFFEQYAVRRRLEGVPELLEAIGAGLVGPEQMSEELGREVAAYFRSLEMDLDDPRVAGQFGLALKMQAEFASLRHLGLYGQPLSGEGAEARILAAAVYLGIIDFKTVQSALPTIKVTSQRRAGSLLYTFRAIDRIGLMNEIAQGLARIPDIRIVRLVSRPIVGEQKEAEISVEFQSEDVLKAAQVMEGLGSIVFTKSGKRVEKTSTNLQVNITAQTDPKRALDILVHLSTLTASMPSNIVQLRMLPEQEGYDYSLLLLIGKSSVRRLHDKLTEYQQELEREGVAMTLLTGIVSANLFEAPPPEGARLAAALPASAEAALTADFGADAHAVLRFVTGERLTPVRAYRSSTVKTERLPFFRKVVRRHEIDFADGRPSVTFYSKNSSGFLSGLLNIDAVSENRIQEMARAADLSARSVLVGRGKGIWLVTEALEGSPLGVRDADSSMVRELGESLGRLHALGIVHGDLVSRSRDGFFLKRRHIYRSDGGIRFLDFDMAQWNQNRIPPAYALGLGAPAGLLHALLGNRELERYLVERAISYPAGAFTARQMRNEFADAYARGKIVGLELLPADRPSGARLSGFGRAVLRAALLALAVPIAAEYPTAASEAAAFSGLLAMLWKARSVEKEIDGIVSRHLAELSAVPAGDRASWRRINRRLGTRAYWNETLAAQGLPFWKVWLYGGYFLDEYEKFLNRESGSSEEPWDPRSLFRLALHFDRNVVRPPAEPEPVPRPPAAPVDPYVENNAKRLDRAEAEALGRMETDDELQPVPDAVLVYTDYLGIVLGPSARDRAFAFELAWAADGQLYIRHQEQIRRGLVSASPQLESDARTLMERSLARFHDGFEQERRRRMNAVLEHVHFLAQDTAAMLPFDSGSADRVRREAVERIFAYAGANEWLRGNLLTATDEQTVRTRAAWVDLFVRSFEPARAAYWRQRLLKALGSESYDSFWAEAVSRRVAEYESSPAAFSINLLSRADDVQAFLRNYRRPSAPRRPDESRDDDGDPVGARLSAQTPAAMHRRLWAARERDDADRVLMELQDHPENLTEAALIDAFGRLEGADAERVRRFHELLKLYESLQKDAFSEKAFLRMLDGLFGKDEDARDAIGSWALEAFRRTNPSAFAEPGLRRTLDALAGADERLRGYAALALGIFAQADARQANAGNLSRLSERMNDRNTFVREQAFDAGRRLLDAAGDALELPPGAAEPVWRALDLDMSTDERNSAAAFLKALFDRSPGLASSAAPRLTSGLDSAPPEKLMFMLDAMSGAVEADPSLARRFKGVIWRYAVLRRTGVTIPNRIGTHALFAMGRVVRLSPQTADRAALALALDGIRSPNAEVVDAALWTLEALVLADPRLALRQALAVVTALPDAGVVGEKARVLLAFYRARGDLRRTIDKLDFPWPAEFRPLPAHEKPLDAYSRKALRVRLGEKRVNFWADWYTHPLIKSKSDRADRSAVLSAKDRPDVALRVRLLDGESPQLELSLLGPGGRAAGPVEIVAFRRNLPLKDTRTGRAFADAVHRLPPSGAARVRAVESLLGRLNAERPATAYGFNPREPYVWVGGVRLYLTRVGRASPLFEVIRDDLREPRFVLVRDVLHPSNRVVVEAAVFEDNRVTDRRSERPLWVGGFSERVTFDAKLDATAAGRRFFRRLTRTLEAIPAGGNADFGETVFYVSPKSAGVDASKLLWIKVPQNTYGPLGRPRAPGSRGLPPDLSYPASLVDLDQWEFPDEWPSGPEEAAVSGGKWLVLPVSAWTSRGAKVPEWLGYWTGRRYGYFRNMGAPSWDAGAALFVNVASGYEMTSIHFMQIGSRETLRRAFTVDGVDGMQGSVYFSDVKRLNLSGLASLLGRFDNRSFDIAEPFKRLAYEGDERDWGRFGLPAEWKPAVSGGVFMFVRATGETSVDPAESDAWNGYLAQVEAAGEQSRRAFLTGRIAYTQEELEQARRSVEEFLPDADGARLSDERPADRAGTETPADPAAGSAGETWADPVRELGDPHMRALFMGILLNWTDHLREKLALMAERGILVVGFEPTPEGYRANFYEGPSGRLLGTQDFTREAIEAFRRDAKLAVETGRPAAAGLGADEAALVLNEENRQVRVLAAEIAKMRDRLEGLVVVDLDRLDRQGESISADFAEHVGILVRELRALREDRAYDRVSFQFVGDPKRVGLAMGLGLGAYQAADAQRAAARKSVEWVGAGFERTRREGSGYVAVGYAKNNFVFPVRPLLHYSLYLLAAHNLPDDPHPFLPAQVSPRVVQEVSRLAGNPSFEKLTGPDVFGFAQGDLSERLRNLASIFAIGPLTVLISAKLAEYRNRLLALGSSA